MSSAPDRERATFPALADAEAEIERLEAELTRVTSAVDVLRQRLRDEIEARAVADAEIARLGDELSFLRSEVLTGDEKTQRGGLFGRLGRGARPSPPAARVAPAAAAPAAPTSRRETRRRDGEAASARSDELDAALQRRLFGE